MSLTAEQKKEWERRTKAITVQELFDRAGVGENWLEIVVKKCESKSPADCLDCAERELPALIKRLKFLYELDSLASAVAYHSMQEEGLI